MARLLARRGLGRGLDLGFSGGSSSEGEDPSSASSSSSSAILRFLREVLALVFGSRARDFAFLLLFRLLVPVAFPSSRSSSVLVALSFPLPFFRKSETTFWSRLEA